MITPFKAVFIRTVTLFQEHCSGNTEAGMRRKLSGQKLKMIGIKRDIAIQITNDLPLQYFHSFIAGVERADFGGKTAVPPLRHLDELHPRVPGQVSLYNLSCVVRRSVIHYDPLQWQNSLVNHRLDCLFNEPGFIAGWRD